MIEKMKKKGISCREATSSEDIHRYHQLLKNYYRLKLRRFVPDETFFQKLSASSNARNVIITYKGKVIGGYTCIYNQGNAYLWFSAFKRKTYIHLHPDTMTIWQALSDAQEQEAQHLHFMDAGLPLKSNLYREFILGFGGKPVTKFRWFRFYPRIINLLLHWLYKD
ncbi:GNAT family N-acetyltransferase [Segatella copri]|uniref:GNAT family N-acetyltransferase n=1 Tax=Segatella copri TaxID=165179 RepID=UPI00294AE915|nr:GNAT family N-acetyltransferase [Segatella copri]WOG30614.1 GNAT family N-acetyltransferase [Segatella copri]